MTDKIEFFTSKILHIHRIKYKIKKSWKIERGKTNVIYAKIYLQQ